MRSIEGMDGSCGYIKVDMGRSDNSISAHRRRALSFNSSRSHWLTRGYMSRLTLLRDAIALAAALLAPSAQAETWPSRPITMVVPYAAGGTADPVGRVLAAGLSHALGQQVIVENVGGAGGMAGTNRVAKA